jgi:hypothetical protein
MVVVQKLWWGQYSLPKTFWVFYVLGNLLVIMLSATIMFVLLHYIRLGAVGLILGIATTNCYLILATVGVWRSAGAGMASPIWMHRIWAALARGVVCIWAARIVWGLVNGGALELMERITGNMDVVL